jgi:hypothetical protein
MMIEWIIVTVLAIAVVLFAIRCFAQIAGIKDRQQDLDRMQEILDRIRKEE